MSDQPFGTRRIVHRADPSASRGRVLYTSSRSKFARSDWRTGRVVGRGDRRACRAPSVRVGRWDVLCEGVPLVVIQRRFGT